jgi:hypothetical protein
MWPISLPCFVHCSAWCHLAAFLGTQLKQWIKNYYRPENPAIYFLAPQLHCIRENWLLVLHEMSATTEQDNSRRGHQYGRRDQSHLQPKLEVRWLVLARNRTRASAWEASTLAKSYLNTIVMEHPIWARESLTYSICIFYLQLVQY